MNIEKIKKYLDEHIEFYEKELNDLICGRMGWNVDINGGQKFYKGYINALKDLKNTIERTANNETKE